MANLIALYGFSKRNIRREKGKPTHITSPFKRTNNVGINGSTVELEEFMGLLV